MLKGLNAYIFLFKRPSRHNLIRELNCCWESTAQLVRTRMEIFRSIYYVSSRGGHPGTHQVTWFLGARVAPSTTYVHVPGWEWKLAITASSLGLTVFCSAFNAFLKLSSGLDFSEQKYKKHQSFFICSKVFLCRRLTWQIFRKKGTALFNYFSLKQNQTLCTLFILKTA